MVNKYILFIGSDYRRKLNDWVEKISSWYNYFRLILLGFFVVLFL